MTNEALTRVRARSMYYGGWIGFVIVTLMTAGMILSVPGRDELGNVVGVSAFTWAIAWFIWLTAHTRLDVDDRHIVVTNTFTRWDIPWSAIHAVIQSGRVAIQLTDGRVVAPTSGQGSLASAIMRNPAQRRIMAAIDAHDPNAPRADAGSVRPRLHLNVAPFVIGLVLVEALAVFTHLS
ncbi:MAG TPA: hypothetical protein VJ914_04540 [Pseudonocardiaceae bacterium]|nr:hypothetical protein [Pseudonocardiaceae bacterium]